MKSPQIVSLVALVVSSVGVATVLMNPTTFGPERLDRGLPDADPLADSAASGAGRESHGQQGTHTSFELRSGQTQRAAIEAAAGASEQPSAGAAEPQRAATLAELRDFREYIRQSLIEVRQENAATRLRELERAAEKLDETVLELSEDLGLTAAQSDRMRSVLLSRFDREAEYLELWEKRADDEILSELKASDRAALVSELSEFLTPAQLAGYLRRF